MAGDIKCLSYHTRTSKKKVDVIYPYWVYLKMAKSMVCFNILCINWISIQHQLPWSWITYSFRWWLWSFEWVFARNLLRGNRRRNIFNISFWCLTWDTNLSFASNKLTHYLLYNCDFYKIIIKIIDVVSVSIGSL